MIYVHLADGFEEIEAITVTDVLRRAGAEVCTVSVLDKLEVKGTHEIEVKADIPFEKADYESCEMIVLPGGMPGTMVLAAAGVLDGRQATIYPGMENYIACATASNEPVVRDGNIITSKAPGTAMKFALALVEALYGREKAERIGKDELHS